MTSGCGLSCTTFVSPISLPQAQMTAQVGMQYPSLYCLPLFPLLPLNCLLFPSSPSLPLSLPSSLSPLISYCTVKLWCANRPHSIFSMGTKANICCIRFRPANQYHMAYGSAGNPLIVKKKEQYLNCWRLTCSLYRPCHPLRGPAQHKGAAAPAEGTPQSCLLRPVHQPK